MYSVVGCSSASAGQWSAWRGGTAEAVIGSDTFQPCLDGRWKGTARSSSAVLLESSVVLSPGMISLGLAAAPRSGVHERRTDQNPLSAMGAPGTPERSSLSSSGSARGANVAVLASISARDHQRISCTFSATS